MSTENENYNEADEIDKSKSFKATDDPNEVGNFNETELLNDVNSFNEANNFNEVESYDTDSSEGNFNETGNTGSYSYSDTNSENNYGGNTSQYSPTAVPAKNNSSKVLVGIVAALALVIVGLIIFIVVKLTNKDNNTTSTQEPTKIETTISADPAGNTNEGVNNGSGTESSTPIEEPKFNVTVELGQYKGVEVNYEVPEVTEEDIEGALEYFASTLEEKTDVTGRTLAEGDTAVIDYEGRIDGELFDGGSATGTELILGSGMFIPGFEDGLIGKNVGDTVSLDISFPDPYQNNPDLSGKPVNFLVTINSAYYYKVPELTDELVAANSEYKTVAEYREAAKEELELQAVEYADSKINNDIIQAVIANSTFGGQVDEQIAYEVQDCIDYYDDLCMQNFGVNGATYFGYIWGITEAEYLAMVEEESTTSVKYNALLDEIAKKENLTVSDEEFEAMFQETFMDTYGFTSKEEVYAQIGEDLANETIRGYVLHDKAEAIIMDSAIINNKPE